MGLIIGIGSNNLESIFYLNRIYVRRYGYEKKLPEFNLPEHISCQIKHRGNLGNHNWP